MIKEKVKITKYNYKKPVKLIVKEYLKTIAISFLCGAVITTCLSIHAKNEMIKNIYANAEARQNINKQIALQLINSNSDLMNDMQKKNYSVCMHIGDIYETAGDYKNAEMAYRFAAEKSKPNDYKVAYKLICVLAAQEKFKEANKILTDIKDHPDKKLIKFKTRSNIVIGDKYYSIGKFLSAANQYEKAQFYYAKFSKRDNNIYESIQNRVCNAYIKTADTMVTMGYNSDAVRFLQKVEKQSPNNLKIKYKLAIILSDSDPEKSVSYLEKLLDKIPQDIDYGIYGNALMKAANIADLEGRHTEAKYYRYKIRSIDMFVNRKVIYKNDIETLINSFSVKKFFYKYPLKATYKFVNNSSINLTNVKCDFVLSNGDKQLETVTVRVADKKHPIYSNGGESEPVRIRFKKTILTRNELKNYTIKIYLYKDEKFKTLVAENRIPEKSFSLENK